MNVYEYLGYRNDEITKILNHRNVKLRKFEIIWKIM